MRRRISNLCQGRRYWKTWKSFNSWDERLTFRILQKTIIRWLRKNSTVIDLKEKLTFDFDLLKKSHIQTLIYWKELVVYILSIGLIAMKLQTYSHFNKINVHIENFFHFWLLRIPKETMIRLTLQYWMISIWFFLFASALRS